MNKKNKRQLNMRNKLMAAIAMLLVSSIMMVSTTYAWFTLSTAPEVQGITTTVGANGNLEIALAPYSGLGTDVKESVVGSSLDDWEVKNLTWGNLLSLTGDEGEDIYGLAELTLLPAQLTASGSILGDAPLATPVYGVDGRISELTANTIIGGKVVTTTTEGDTTTTETSAGYYADGGYGVRAVGTSSTMTERELAYNTYLSGIKSNSSQANKAASTSLNANGNALANMMVAHAQAGSSDGTNYSQYVDELVQLTADLDSSVDYIGKSLKSAVLAGLALDVDGTTDDDFATIQKAVEALEPSELFGGDYDEYISSVDGLSGEVEKWEAIASDVSAAQAAANALVGKETVSWSEVSGVLQYLMDTTDEDSESITVAGYTIAQIREKMNDMNFLLTLATNCNIVLGEGSGVYYDIAAMTGTINSAMTATVYYNDSPISLDATISTTSVTGSLTVLYSAVQGLGSSVTFGTGEALIDVFYGYVVDLMFRTNVSGSNLLLQTEGVQRIYSDGTNTETMGNGSTITFTLSNTTSEEETETEDSTAGEDETESSTESSSTSSTTSSVNVNTVKGLIEAVNVVFFDPDTKEIYGIAKVTGTSINTLTDGSQSVVGDLGLWSYTVDANGYVTLDEANALTGVAATKICSLDQNTAKAVSALVFLDGNNVSNADVLNDENLQGTLNLQFSSSAELVPMDNSELKSGATTETDADVAETTTQADESGN